MSPVYDCTTEEGRAEGVARAAEAVRNGEVVVLPTDTVYGVGADAFSPEAVASVLAAKGRGREMPPPVLVPSVRTVDGLASDVPQWARELIEAFWPGPLTLVLSAQSSLMWDLGETNGTVALRMPPGEFHEFPTTTPDAIYSGALQAIRGAIGEMRQRLHGTASEITCYVAGGGAQDIAPRLAAPVEVVDNLVLEGVLVLALLPRAPADAADGSAPSK